jgi:hypothetical protein
MQLSHTQITFEVLKNLSKSNTKDIKNAKMQTLMYDLSKKLSIKTPKAKA